MRISDWSSDVCSSDLLDAAYRQATDYFAGLTDAELPRYDLVSDFARFRLYDLDGEAGPVEFALADLPRQIGRFGFISGYQIRRSEARRVGKGGGRTCKFRWSQKPKKKKTHNKN